jgi:uncharacterized protein with ATP-grasp and redox domains
MVNHALHVSKMVTRCPETRKQIMKKTLEQIATIDFDSPPPEMARNLHAIIRGITGVDDPYEELKDMSTSIALQLLPELRAVVENSPDSFETIVRLVIAGNIIDFGADSDFQLSTARDRVLEVLSMPLDLNAVRELKQKLDSARNILYLCDNCGEAVIDRLLIEPYKDKITVAVRGGAILNDVTSREAEHSGLHELTRVIDNGDRSPGTVLKHVDDEFMRLFNSADLIISKGQGNFETLSDTDRPICFLLRIKCAEVLNHINDGELGSIQVINKNFHSSVRKPAVHTAQCCEPAEVC